VVKVAATNMLGGRFEFTFANILLGATMHMLQDLLASLLKQLPFPTKK